MQVFVIAVRRPDIVFAKKRPGLRQTQTVNQTSEMSWIKPKRSSQLGSHISSKIMQNINAFSPRDGIVLNNLAEQ